MFFYSLFNPKEPYAGERDAVLFTAGTISDYFNDDLFFLILIMENSRTKMATLEKAGQCKFRNVTLK